jgi:hypothetical protein
MMFPNTFKSPKKCFQTLCRNYTIILCRVQAPPKNSGLATSKKNRGTSAERIPTNMGVAQLASHFPLYPNSRMRPIFSFPAAPAAAVTPEACPYQRTHR